MSYNRGNYNRDGGRRSNDYGGGNRRSGNYQNNFGNYNSSMNPWEGGMVPGRGSGLLPSPSQGGNLLSQLTSPEAQLALASNLINKLITHQTGSSILSLGNLGSAGGHMSSYNDGYGGSRNYPDRRRDRMDHRRTEPYNKSAMNRRMGPDHRNLSRNRMGSDRKNLSKSFKSQKDDKKDKDADKNGDVKDDSADDSKRDEDGKSDDEQGEDDEHSERKKGREHKSEPIPAALLYCHVCSKNMWDEISFTKHMKGRPHQLMMDGVNEKYKLKVNLLRHEMRLCEQQRELKMEMKQRQGMKMFNHSREYCAMCDLYFHGNLISHRKNVRHQKLKAFLHPKCSHCDKEFSTRLEWDDHRLTFAHLYKVAEFRRVNKPHLKDDEFDIEELVNPENVNCGELLSKEVPVLVRQNSDEDLTIDMKEEHIKEREVKKEAVDEEGEEAAKGEDEVKEEIVEPEAPQNIDTDPSKLPKYNPAAIIGKELLKPASGYICQVCNRFLQGEEEAQAHCRGFHHHMNFCNVVRAKARVTVRKRRAPIKSEEKMEDEKNEDETEEEKKDEINEDNDGNWKRHKNSEETAENISKMDVDEIKEEESRDQGEIPDAEWETVSKDISSMCEAEGKGTEAASVEEEPEAESVDSPRRPQRATRGRRGGKRGK